MIIFDLWRQIRKRLRAKRKWFGLALWAIVFAIGSWGYSSLMNEEQAARMVMQHINTPSVDPKEEDWMAALRKQQGPVDVTLRRLYVCGEETIQLGSKQPSQIMALYEQNPGWEGVLVDENTFVFKERIEDLSPRCKEAAYIGVDRDGNLTLFDGPPQEDHAVRTFFQLNIEHLESSLPKEMVRQLQEGIRISDLAEYNSVLSTFSSFAAEQTEKVMKPSL
ncbi:BofC C-terminal domain-containing protein [Paenibacillus turpanensis]|uniref:BofC C-terminal domain-containing protein n=1 Tax=Paenibacillus turpanensis TaxID=2689078 RepID=UPI001407B7DE|nr:BofC C-terminal domain-containing protein [Paenibacillus turpanensis]